MHAKRFIVLLIALVAIVVLASPFGVLAQEPTPVPWTEQAAVALYNITGTYSVTECLYEGQTEPNCLRLAGTIQMRNPFDQWVDGYRRCDGEIRPAFAGMQRSARISIPPNYRTTTECFVEVLVARPAAPEQQSSLEERGQSEIQWTLEEARRFFELTGPQDGNILRHGLQSWEVPFIEGQAWAVTNVCENWIDGFRVNPGEVRPDFSQHPDRELVSIPPHSYAVEVTMATLRPCEEPQMFNLTPLGAGNKNIRSAPSEQSEIVSQLVVGQSLPSDGFVQIGEQNWYRVWVEDNPAWIAGWVVTVTPIAPAIAEAPAPAAQPALAATPAPQTAPVTDWSEATVRSVFSLPAETILTACAGEENCWQTTGPHSITNSTSCWQGGYTTTEHQLMEGQSDAKTGIPPGWTGTAEIAVLRPCS